MLKNLIIIAVIFLALDAIYLFSFKDLTLPMIYRIQKTELKTRIEPIIGCYILLIFGLYYFIIRKRAEPLDAFLLGFVIYGVYETTNYAILKDWSPLVVVMDSIWGGLLFMITTIIYKNVKTMF